MKSLAAVFLFLAGVVGLLADDQKWIAVSMEDKGKTLSARLGQEILISLKGNPTTGYLWTWSGVDGESVAPSGEVTYQADNHPPRMVGVGGVFLAKLKTVKRGRATVHLTYRRPWEKDVKPAETFDVTISVVQ